MTEEEVKNDLNEIKSHLKSISKNTRAAWWKPFVNGSLAGFGSITGATIGLILIGWILNTIGVIPALRGEVQRLNRTLDYIQQNK